MNELHQIHVGSIKDVKDNSVLEKALFKESIDSPALTRHVHDESL